MTIPKHFSLKRFNSYLKYDFSLNYKNYLLFIVGAPIALFIFIFASLTSTQSTFTIYQYSILLYGSFCVSYFFICGTSFPAFRNRVESMYFLMLPISNFEKFIVQVFFRLLLFPCLFIFLFWIDFNLAKQTYLLMDWAKPISIHDIRLFDFLGIINSKNITIAVILITFSVATFFIAGAAAFKKYATIKTLLILGLLIGSALLFIVLLSYCFYSDATQGFEIEINAYEIFGKYLNTHIFLYTIGALSSLFLLPLAFFKLKEREV